MLRRGLPYSVLVHLLGIILVVMFGNHVARAPVRAPKSISVKMVRMPQSKPPTVVTTPVEVVQQKAQPEIKPDLTPKELPEAKPVEKKVVKEVQPEIKAPESEVIAKTVEPVQAVAQPLAKTPMIKGTDEDFPFAWYISRVEGKIIENFKPKQLGFGKRAIVSCAVHFRIGRNGVISQVTLVRNSGVGVYDRSALSAVTTTKLPPLPPQFKGSSLGITFIFNMEPGQ